MSEQHADGGQHRGRNKTDPEQEGDMDDLGERIREKRQAKGMTQADVADQLGVSVPAVSNWENGNGNVAEGLRETVKQWLGDDVGDTGESDTGDLATIIDVSRKANGDIQATYQTGDGGQWRGTLSIDRMEFTKEGFREFREALKGTEVRKPW